MPTLSELLPKSVPPLAVRRTATVQWRLLHESLAAIKSEISDPAARGSVVVELLSTALCADYAAWISLNDAGEAEFEAEKIAAEGEPNDPRTATVNAVRRSLETASVVAVASDEGRHILAVGVVAEKRRRGLVAIVPAGLDPTAGGSALQLAARTLFADAEGGATNNDLANGAVKATAKDVAAAGAKLTTETAAVPSKSADNASSVAAALELAVRLAESADVKTAAKALCDLLQRRLKAEHVAVGIVKRAGTTVEPAALSDIGELDLKSETAALLQDCLTESLPQTPVITWSRASESNPTGLGKWRQLADGWQSAELAAFRFTDRNGEAVAVCLIATATELDSDGERFATLSGQIAGPILRMLERAGYGRRLHDLKRKIPTWFRGRNAWITTAVLALPFVYPWCSRTSCPVVLEPIAHRLVAAPFEGVFDESLVMPGDRVEAGQVLGKMDGRELRSRLAACDADLSRAAKSRDVNLAAGKLAGAQIDRLEMERLEHERDLLRRRLEQLEIRSPIAGIVVTGDLRRYEGATLKVGHSLYEIAPMDRLTAELAIAEEDLERVLENAEATIRLDAVSGGGLEGRIERIRPRGELRDNRQVFVAEVSLPNDADHLRPGMKGTATVIGPRAPGIWQLVRKPWYAAQRFVGW
jgi:hypothetical protein